MEKSENENDKTGKNRKILKSQAIPVVTNEKP